MIDPNHCTVVVEDSRDDDGTAIDNVRRGQSLLCEVDDDESIVSLVSVSSWLSFKLSLPSILSVKSRPAGTSVVTSLLSFHDTKPFNEDPTILRSLEQDGLSLSTMSPCVQSSHPHVLAAVRQNGLALQYASSNLRDDITQVMSAVSQNGLSIRYASDRLRSNTSVALIAVSNNGKALQYVSRTLRSDFNIVMAAVLNDGVALEYASTALRNVEEVVLTAVRQNRNAVRYLGHEYLGRVPLSEIMDMVKRRTCLV